MNDILNKFQWHDAEICSVHIDRMSAGINDSIILNIKWPDGKNSAVKFEDCYAARFELNFGIIASEAILDFSLRPDEPFLHDTRQTWIHMGVELPDLNCARIETSSTGSVLMVCFKSINISKPQ